MADKEEEKAAYRTRKQMIQPRKLQNSICNCFFKVFVIRYVLNFLQI